MKISYCRQGKRTKETQEKKKNNLFDKIHTNKFKFIKKTQIVIIIITLMVMLAAYYNYAEVNSKNILDLSVLYDVEKYGGLGDATLVSGEAEDENNLDNQEKTENQNNQESGINYIESEEAVSKTNEVKTEPENKIEKNQYYAQSRLEREKMYSQMLETYQSIMDNNSISTEQKSIAEKEVIKINNQKNGIMISENLIKSKGFEDAIIFINDQDVTVVIKAKELKKEEIAQIQNIVMRELNTDVENIHISTKDE